MHLRTGMPNGESPAVPPLRLLFWESTSRCNLACIHCRRLDADQAGQAGELTTEQAKRVFESAATLGRPIAVFSGGEPLLRRDWHELAQYARSLGLTTALATNATLVDGKLSERIASAGFHRVSVSFDGADAPTHDAFRGLAGAFDAAVAGSRHIRSAGVALQVNATIAAHNVNQLDGLLTLARRLDACALHLFLLVPVGCGVQIAQTHQLSPDQYESVLGWICDRQGAGLEIKATCAPHYYRLAAARGLDVRRSRGCLCGLGVAFVSHQGEVFPCGYLPVSCGDVRQTPLAELWRNSEVFASLRDLGRLKGRCGRCEYRGICGGCRARAYAATGDYLAAEPACTHQPANRPS